jgi:GTP-binding protein
MAEAWRRLPLLPRSRRRINSTLSTLNNEGKVQAPSSTDASPHALASPLQHMEEEEEKEEEEAFPVIQLQLPTPTHTRVKTAVYLKSVVSHEDCPSPRYPEFAVIGRSNVGKSSLINMMTNSKNLARVSKEPGKTRCINHFLINDSWYLVDLPGYGYAKVGEVQRGEFESFTKAYFKGRSNLVMVFLLVDSTVRPQKVDLDYACWLTDHAVPFSLVFTKTDKKRKGVDRAGNMTEFKKELLKTFEFLPPFIATSSEDGSGKNALLHLIGGLRVAYEESH